MSGPTGPRAAYPSGGFLQQPPLDRGEVERIVGTCDWAMFQKAYEDFGWGMFDLDASRANRNKNDPNSWHGLRAAVSGDLRNALELIHRQYDNGDKPESGARLRFIREASQHYRLMHPADEADSVLDALHDAGEALRRALTIVLRAEPMSLQVASEAELRRRLVRALGEACGCRHASDGWTLDQLSEGAAESDLTAFERLIATLEIHVAETPAALSRWVRKALSDAN